MPELLFINKTQSSDVLTRSKADEKSRILSHVQNRRRRDEARRKRDTRVAQPSLDKPYGLQFQVEVVEVRRPKDPFSPTSNTKEDGQYQNLVRLALTYPTHNSSDPFYSTVAGRDVGSHAMLSLTFSKGVKMTFLSEAFAPPSVLLDTDNPKRFISMRHDAVIQARLHRCIEDDLLMHATLAYGSSCLAWMFGILDTSRPPEYFIGKAISRARHRIANPSPPDRTGGGCERAEEDKQWFALSIYSLAITENWNHMPPIWVRCPSRQALALRKENASRAASRMHLQALARFIDDNGGWGAFDPYIMESAILADKYLSLWEMESPIIPLTWDPGPLSRAVRDALGIDEDEGTKSDVEMGNNLLHLPLCEKLKDIIADIADYARIARAAWAQPEIVTFEPQSWLFLRLQSFYFRLMLLDEDRLSRLDDCIKIIVLTFLLATTHYHGAAVCAANMVSKIRSALVHARFWDENVFGSRGLRFWCLCTGAIAAGATLEREWFLGQIAEMAAAGGDSEGSRRHEWEGRERLDGYLFLWDSQGTELSALINELPFDAALYCMNTFL
ncbi:Transcription factor domain-containing protein (Fragment) [Madurella fahalii]|uniref:Transcription factor domain-containing protein n=1 Tax=Madurella fahalii TaxID=1157608 RepID=A0ABQ0GH04_9PEZI